MSDEISTPLDVGRAIREGYLRYFDTAFWLRDKELMEERRKILESDGVVFTDSLIEPLLPYDSTISIVEVFRKWTIDDLLADKLAKMLFGRETNGDFRLRTHQAQALSASISTDSASKRNVVVTAGTGSGKTECFLLPILTRLLVESAAWGPPAKLHRWWDKAVESDRWRHSRSDSARQPTVAPVWVYPSMITGFVMVGKALAGWIVNGPVAMLKLMLSVTPSPFASKIACRKEPAPVSLVLVTVNVAAWPIDADSTTSLAVRERVLSRIMGSSLLR